MAHMITGTDAMLSVHEMPWHGLGAVLSDYPTREEAQALAHPWEPVEQPVYRRIPQITAEGDLHEEFVEVEGSKVIERSDNGQTLGIVNESFGIVGNGQMWDVIEAVGKIGTDIKIETAGSLEGGKRVWSLLRLTEPIAIKGDPQGETLAFLAFQNGHTGQAAFRAQAVNTRIVCANTSAAADVEAKRHGYEFTFKHTSGVQSRIDEAKATVAMWREGVTQWQMAMEHLITERVSPVQQEWFVTQFQPMPPEHLITDRVRNNVETARNELRGILTSQTQVDISHTAYGLYMAGIEWVQHFRQVKGKDERARMESHFKRSMMGDNALRKSILTVAQEAALV